MDLTLNAKAGDIFVDDASTAQVKITSDTAAGTNVTVPVENAGTVAVVETAQMTLKVHAQQMLIKVSDCYLLP